MESRCTATLEFGDDFGDNSCTMHCMLEPGHAGPHAERGNCDYSEYTLTWVEQSQKGEWKKRFAEDAA